MSVKFIGEAALASIETQLRLVNLRKIDQVPVPQGDLNYDLTGSDGSVIARFAWTPKQPGAEIVHNVVPFVAVALTGFALLAAFVLRYMRRTAAAIAAGESRLRHLAMHDPLCGLPNRIFFGERLEAVIEEVRNGSAPAAVFKDGNDTLGTISATSLSATSPCACRIRYAAATLLRVLAATNSRRSLRSRATTKR